MKIKGVCEVKLGGTVFILYKFTWIYDKRELSKCLVNRNLRLGLYHAYNTCRLLWSSCKYTIISQYSTWSLQHHATVHSMHFQFHLTLYLLMIHFFELHFPVKNIIIILYYCITMISYTDISNYWIWLYCKHANGLYNYVLFIISDSYLLYRTCSCISDSY